MGGVCVEETITVDLQSLLDKFVLEDCRGSGEMGRGRIQLLMCRHFQVPCSLLQARYSECVVEGHPCWRSGRRNNVWQHRRKGGRKDAGCCLSSLWPMSAAVVSRAPVQVLAASQGMGLLAPCLFSARWQLAVPSPTYQKSCLFLHRLCALFLHCPWHSAGL